MAKPPSSPGLAELIDLELALADLEDHRVAARAAGDACCEEARLGTEEARRRAETDPSFRHRLALAWLQRLRQGGVPLPGALLTRSLTAAGKFLLLIALLGGIVTASSTLRYDGSAPVNLWAFLGVFVLLQLVLLLGTLWIALRRPQGSSVGAGPLGGWVERLASHPWLQRVVALPEQETRESWRKLRERRESLQRSHLLFAKAETWMLIRFSQAAGVVFHLAAALTFLAVVLFSDLSFAWSTTPAGMDASWLHGLTSTLALPWAWLAPEAAPSLEAVSMTQWNRLESAFVADDQAAATAAAAGWWSFLLAAQLFWGLLPRLLTWLFARRRSRKLEASYAFDHAGFHALFDAMLLHDRGKSSQGWSGPKPEEVQGELVEALPEPATPTAPTESGARDAVAAAWGAFPHAFDAAASRLQQSLGWRMHQAAKPSMIGGSDAAESKRELARVIKAAQAQSSSIVVLYAEGGEAPNKALLRTIGQLREALPNTSLAVVLVDAPDEETVGLWRGYLARAKDPHLRLEVLR